MNTETIPQTSGTLSPIEAVLRDKKVRKSFKKIGTRSLSGAGITRQTMLTRKTKFRPVGTLEAFASPGKALFGAAEKAGKEVPKLIARIGHVAVRSTIDNINSRLSRPTQRAEASPVNEPMNPPAESTASSTNLDMPAMPEALPTSPSSTSTANAGESLRLAQEPLDLTGTPSSNEYSPPLVAADSTAGTTPDQITFGLPAAPETPSAPAIGPVGPVEQAQSPFANSIARPDARPVAPLVR